MYFLNVFYIYMPPTVTQNVTDVIRASDNARASCRRFVAGINCN